MTPLKIDVVLERRIVQSSRLDASSCLYLIGSFETQQVATFIAKVMSDQSLGQFISVDINPRLSRNLDIRQNTVFFPAESKAPIEPVEVISWFDLASFVDELLSMRLLDSGT